MTTAAIDHRNSSYGGYNPFAGIVTGVSDVAKNISAKIVNINSARLQTVTGRQPKCQYAKSGI